MKVFFIKLLITLTLLFLCFKLKNINTAIIKEINYPNITDILSAFLILLLSLFFLFIRNIILMSIHVKDFLFNKYIFIYIKSLVLSNLGFLGGSEIYRVYLRKVIKISFTDLITVIFVERGMSLVAIFFLLFFFTAYNLFYFFIFIIFFYIIFINKEFYLFLFKKPYLNFFNYRLNFFLLKRDIIIKKKFFIIFILSIIIQIISIIMGYIFFKNLINISFYDFAYIAIILNLLLSIPSFTISGLGMREVLYLLLMSNMYFDKNLVYQSSVHQSLFLVLFWIIIFLLVFIFDKKNPKKNQKKIYSK
jgi:uncharacterized membrane protein YbhN (UPF0104 family)